LGSFIGSLNIDEIFYHYFIDMFDNHKVLTLLTVVSIWCLVLVSAMPSMINLLSRVDYFNVFLS